MSNIGRVCGGINLHRSETSKGSTDCETSESHFCDGCVYNPFLSKLVHEAFGDLHGHGGSVESFAWVERVEADLVSTVVPGNLFTKDKYVFVAEHFLLHRLVQRLSDSHL